MKLYWIHTSEFGYPKNSTDYYDIIGGSSWDCEEVYGVGPTLEKAGEDFRKRALKYLDKEERKLARMRKQLEGKFSFNRAGSR